MKKERKAIPPEGIRDSFKELGVPKTLVLGLQHMFAMFGATILVPILVMGYFQAACGEPLTRGVTVSTTLFCAGVGTLIFHLCTKLKVPAFLGSSFAFLGGFSTVANLNSGAYATMSANDKVAYACGGVVIAGLLYLVLALVIKIVGVKRVMRFLPPVVTGPIIICIGLTLSGSAISNASTNWLIAVVALAVIIIFNIWGKGMFKIIPILMGVLIAYVFALILNAVGITNPDGSAILSFSSVAEAGWVGLPAFQMCKFDDFYSCLIFPPIAIASMMEHIGDISAISATTERNFIEDPGLQRTLWAAPHVRRVPPPPPPTPPPARPPHTPTGVLELSRCMIPLSSVWLRCMPSSCPSSRSSPPSSPPCPPPSSAACPSCFTA